MCATSPHGFSKVHESSSPRGDGMVSFLLALGPKKRNVTPDTVNFMEWDCTPTSDSCVNVAARVKIAPIRHGRFSPWKKTAHLIPSLADFSLLTCLNILIKSVVRLNAVRKLDVTLYIFSLLKKMYELALLHFSN